MLFYKLNYILLDCTLTLLNLNLKTSSIVVSSIFAIHLVNGTQFLNATCVSEASVTVISPLTLKCKHRWNHKD